jgi:uncharacterized protein YfaS (alpha-2-macroglobulin family)
MSKSYKLVSLFVLFGLLFSACGPGASPSPSPSPVVEALPTASPTPMPPTPPTLVERLPALGEEQPLDAPITLTFDQPMDKESVQAAFSISPAAPGEFSWPDERTLSYQPGGEGFGRGRSYTVTVSDRALSKAGLPLEQPVSFIFNTVSYLEVAVVQPAPDSSNIALNALVTVLFNRPVVPLTAISEQAALPQPLTFTPPLTGEGQWLNSSIYTFRPDKGFEPATTYKGRVAAGLSDTTGGILEVDYTWTFTTVLPAVVATFPRNNDIYVNPSSTISVTFNQPMDHQSAQEKFSLREKGGKTGVVGEFSWHSKPVTMTGATRAGYHSEEEQVLLSYVETMGFTPQEPLAHDTIYEIEVSKGAKSASGKVSTQKSYTSKFTTIDLPRIVSTTPKDGDEQADPYDNLEINFSAPMDPDSLVPGKNLMIEPRVAVTQVYTYWREWESNTSVFVSFPIEPSTPYTVTIGPGLRSRIGDELDEPYELHFTTRAYDPLIYLHTPGRVSLYSAYTPTLAYVTYRNVTALDFSLYSLSSADFRTLNGENWWDVWDTYSPQDSNLVRHWTKPVNPPLNASLITYTELDADGAALAPGLYYLMVKTPERKYAMSRAIIVVSAYNITLKSTASDALAWVTDLRSGQVVPDLPLTLTDEMGNELGAGRSDRDGVFTARYEQRDPWKPLFAFAGDPDTLTAGTGHPGPDFAVAASQWDEGIASWQFDLPTEGVPQAHIAHFYTDRPIYRPGQKVYFKGVLRQDDDAHYTLPKASTEVAITVSDSQGREIYQEDLPLNDMGTLNGEVSLDEEAALGYYYLEARLGDESFGASFQVAEYRKPEYEVGVETDKPAYVSNDKVKATAQATYYFGGPVAGAQVRYSVLSADYWFHYTGKGWYDFTDYDFTRYRQPPYGTYGELIDQGSGQTDEQGRFTFATTADIAERTQSQLFTIEATVTDVNNQEVSNRTEAVVHKGLFYIGLAPQAYVGKVDEEQEISCITVDWESEPVASRPISATVYQHKWYSVREKGEDGRYYWTSQVEDTPIFTTSLTTDEEGRATLAFTPHSGGNYKIAASGLDDEKNLVSSSTYMWVSGYKYVNWRQEDSDRIDLIADKKLYQVGDTAKILIPSPYQGEVQALLTIERGHVIEHKLLTLATNSEQVEIPITADSIPNIYVSAVIVKGEGETGELASFKVGYVALAVSSEEKELKITLTPNKAEHYTPGETVTYTVKAADYAGRPVEAEFSLQMVDKAVLALAESAQGTLLNTFWRERGLGVNTASGLTIYAERINVAIAPEAKGGGGGGPGEEGGVVRRRFPDTAYWNAEVRTDKEGRAEVSLQLPDNLTTWRFSGQAVTADTEVGESLVDIVSTKDLLVRPAVPRFFVVGDRAELSAVVHNATDAALSAEVSLSTEGARMEGQPQTVTIPAGDKKVVSWPVTAEDVDAAKLLFVARQTGQEAGAGLYDAVEITLPVYRYSTPEVVATAGELKEDGQRLETVRLPRRYDPSQGELSINLDPSLAAGMRDGLDYLEHYPYECTEQTVSRFLPNVVTYRALKKLGLENKELETKLPQMVGVGLQRLYAQQHYDGGWGWWLLDRSNPFLSSYVLLGLVEADKAGFVVEKDVINRAVDYLTGSLQQPSDIERPWSANNQAFILYVLAEAGEGDLGRTVKLYEQRQLLGNYGKAFLAMALGILEEKKDGKHVDTLLNDLTSSAIVSATGAHWEEIETDWWTMNTNTRSTAVVLAALARLAPDEAIAPNAVRWLMVARKKGSWETTQETAWSIMALTDWMEATGELEGNYRYEVSFNGQKIGTGEVTKETVGETRKLQVAVRDMLADQLNQVLIDRLPPDVTPAQAGTGRLYYSMYLRYYLPAEEVKALSRGIIVSRQYTLADDPGKVVDSASVGDVIKVKITVIAPNDLYYLVVEDPLPAGAEGLDTSLKTTSVVGERPELERTDLSDPWGLGWGWWYFSQTEMRDEKVVLFATYLPKGTYEYTYLMRASAAGKFKVIPTNAYEMYFPEVFGRSDGALFEIVD